MVEDARQRTKAWLTLWLDNDNLTKDDDTTPASFIICYADADYPMIKVFVTKGVDLIFTVGNPESEPEIDTDKYPVAYRENVPIGAYCINKSGITGTFLRSKAELELRRISEEHPLSSVRRFQSLHPDDKMMGSTVIYGGQYVLSYTRDLT